MNIYRPLMEQYPKAEPLARTLIAAASEQGANAEELKLACDLAMKAYQMARDNSLVSLAKFESEAQATLNSF